MSNRIKPWHQRKPKHQDSSFKDHRPHGKRKKDAPMRLNSDELPSHLQVDDNEWEYDPANYSERWES